MTRFTATVIGLCGCLLVLPCTVPVLGAPFFVRVYGRTYKVDSRIPSDMPEGAKPQESLRPCRPTSPEVPALSRRTSRSWPTWRNGPGLPATSLPTNWRRVPFPARGNMPELTRRRSIGDHGIPRERGDTGP